MGKFSFQVKRFISYIIFVASYRLDSFKSNRLRTLVVVILALGLSLYSYYFRSFQVSEHFFLLGDQIRDWNRATKPFSELPLVGTPTSKGGYCLGPVFYWTLWFIRITLGKFHDNLPHAGGMGLAAIHAVADGVLLLAILKRGIPIGAAVAAMLTLVSSPFEAALSGTIWNPGLAVSFVELTIAAFLLIPNSRPLLRTFMTSVLAWLAVQAHTQAIFFALALLLYLPLEALKLDGARVAIKRVLLIAAVILVLQVPYFIYITTNSDASQGQSAIVSESFKTLTSAPLSIKPYGSLKQLLDSMIELFAFPLGRVLMLLIIGLATAGLISRWKEQRDMLAVGLLPLVLAWLGYSLLQVGTLYTYWYMNLMPAFLLLVLFGFLQNSSDALKKAFALAGLLLLPLALAAQPHRLAERAKLASYPHYAAVVRGAKEIVRHGEPVRLLVPPAFELESDTDYLVRWLGGRIEATASSIAVIGEDGSVTYQRVQDEPPK
jgi:hypothetical protein